MPNLDTVLTDAYAQLNVDRRSSTEGITCDPAYRNPFLHLVHLTFPEVSEADALRRLSYPRKQSGYPESIGAGVPIPHAVHGETSPILPENASIPNDRSSGQPSVRGRATSGR